MMEQKNWTTIIIPNSKWYHLNIREIWEYRDLISIFVKRDIISIYKQTILGPLWFLLGPLFTVFTYTFLFSEVAHLSTDGLPGPLFYLGGTTLWNYFQACFNGASSTFSANAGIFGKVYFPRLVTPISLTISNLLKLSFQFLTYIGFLIYYFQSNETLSFHFELLFLIPLVILVLAMIAMGTGIIVSSFTSKYRDLSMVVGIGITLLMYATPIMYPVSAIPELYKPYLYLNPISPLIESFRYVFTGTGTFTLFQLCYSFMFGFMVLLIGIFVFNRTEKTFMDTV
ncbi:MAG: ABC transporter permease [Bacteroidia bacterium]|nr:ABC transporter permease [Bacteroidia bacterium]